MTSSTEVAKCLAYAPRDVPVEIKRIRFESAVNKCADRGLHEGDTVRLIGALPGHVLLMDAQGHRILLEQSVAVMIEVDRAQG